MLSPDAEVEQDLVVYIYGWGVKLYKRSNDVREMTKSLVCLLLLFPIGVCYFRAI